MTTKSLLLAIVSVLCCNGILLGQTAIEQNAASQTANKSAELPLEGIVAQIEKLKSEAETLKNELAKLDENGVDPNNAGYLRITLALERVKSSLEWLVSWHKTLVHSGKVVQPPAAEPSASENGNVPPTSTPFGTFPGSEGYGSQQEYQAALGKVADMVCTVYPPYCAYAKMAAQILGALFGADPEVIDAGTRTAHNVMTGQPADPEDLKKIAENDEAVQGISAVLANKQTSPNATKEQKEAASKTADSFDEVFKDYLGSPSGRVAGAVKLAKDDAKSAKDVMDVFDEGYKTAREKASFLANIVKLKNDTQLKCKEPTKLLNMATNLRVSQDSQTEDNRQPKEDVGQ